MYANDRLPENYQIWHETPSKVRKDFYGVDRSPAHPRSPCWRFLRLVGVMHSTECRSSFSLYSVHREAAPQTHYVCSIYGDNNACDLPRRFVGPPRPCKSRSRWSRCRRRREWLASTGCRCIRADSGRWSRSAGRRTYRHVHTGRPHSRRRQSRIDHLQ